MILFSPSQWEPPYRVSASGGTPMAVTKLESSPSHRWPLFLPDGRHFLFLAFNIDNPSGNGIYFASLDSKEPKLLLQVNSSVAYAPPGYLLFWRDGTLFAQPSMRTGES